VPIDKMAERVPTATARNQFFPVTRLKGGENLRDETETSRKYKINLLFNIVISSAIEN
jgi:hypothetical protein